MANDLDYRVKTNIIECNRIFFMDVAQIRVYQKKTLENLELKIFGIHFSGMK